MNAEDAMKRITEELRIASLKVYEPTGGNDLKTLATSTKHMIKSLMPDSEFNINVFEVDGRSNIQIHTKDDDLINLLNEVGFETVIEECENSEYTVDRVYIKWEIMEQ